MILACNTESFLTVNLEEAKLILKQSTGNVKLLVDNPKEEVQAREEQTVEAKKDMSPPRQREEGKKLLGKLDEEKAKAAVLKSPAKTPARSPAKDVATAGKVEIKLSPGDALGMEVVGGADSDVVREVK